MENIEKDFKLFANDHGVSNSVLSDYSRALGLRASYIEPSIIEENVNYMTQLSVFSRLFMERILFIGTDINNDVANIVNSQLLYLQMSNNKKPVTLYINSNGGSVYDGMSIYDTMNFITCPVHTVCMGTAASMGAVLLAAGEEGNRRALPHSQILLHAPSGGTGRVTAPDMRIAAREMEKCEDMLYKVLAKHMHKDYDYIKKICDRDYWLEPTEAISEGVIDSIIERAE